MFQIWLRLFQNIQEIASGSIFLSSTSIFLSFIGLNKSMMYPKNLTLVERVKKNYSKYTFKMYM